MAEDFGSRLLTAKYRRVCNGSEIAGEADVLQQPFDVAIGVADHCHLESCGERGERLTNRGQQARVVECVPAARDQFPFQGGILKRELREQISEIHVRVVRVNRVVVIQPQFVHLAPDTNFCSLELFLGRMESATVQWFESDLQVRREQRLSNIKEDGVESRHQSKASTTQRRVIFYNRIIVAKIGVLALQGDFDAHRKRLEELGAEVVLVRKPEELDGLDGLVIPGGESSTFLKLLGAEGLARLREFVLSRPSFGTCAGCIMLATEVENPTQTGLGALDIRVRRNAYGRQIDSSIRQGVMQGSPIEMVFIRAPKIVHVGDGVEVVAREGNDPVLVRKGKTLAATFHPELSADTRVHQYFLDVVRNGRA